MEFNWKKSLASIILASSLFSAHSQDTLKTTPDSVTTEKLDSNNVHRYIDEGVSLFKRREYDLAIKEFDKAIELDSNNSKSYFNRGATFCEKGDYNLAIKDLNKAIELDSNDVMSYFYRGFAYENIKETEKANADFDKARKLKFEKILDIYEYFLEKKE